MTPHSRLTSPSAKLGRRDALGILGSAFAGIAAASASPGLLRPGIARAATPGMGPFTLQALSNNLGFECIDGTGKVLLGITYTSTAHTAFYYFSSYVKNGPLMTPAYAESPNTTVTVYPGITVTSGSSTITPTSIVRHPWGSSSYAAIAPGNPTANTTHSLLGHNGAFQQPAGRLYREGGGGGGGGPHAKGKGHLQPGGAIGCTIGSITLVAATGGVAASGFAAVGEAGLNPFADAGFWGMLTAWGASWGYWDYECF